MNEQIETLGAWEVIGDEERPNHGAVLDATQLATHWRRCSLTADFWARYTAFFVPAEVEPGRLGRAAMADVLAYLLNELFENCAKFSAGPVQTIAYQSWLRHAEIVVQLTNHTHPEGQAAFRAIIQEILDGDPDTLYFQKLEENVELNRGGSGLGYLTLIKDYSVRFGFRFRPLPEGSVAVDVQAHISMQEDN